jgi:toxin ParE1/3/4
MSLLRKGNKMKIATKTLSHKGTQSVYYKLYALCETLSLSAFVAGLYFSEGSHQYYKVNASIAIARKIRIEIFTATRQLKKHPVSGPIELNLEKINEGHRYLVKGHYKIIYKEVSEGVLITDVFDTRQDPLKINDEQRNPGM